MDILRVVVVDDNKNGADILARLLELWGYEVKTAYSARAALRLVADFKPVVVLADIAMPDMNGLKFAECIRQNPALDDITLVAITGFTDNRLRWQARDAGFDELFIKPVEPDVIREWLAAVAGRQEAGRGPERLVDGPTHAGLAD
jgi:CheY-like chemotaxis protein